MTGTPDPHTLSIDQFDHTPGTRVLFAPGAVTRVGELARELGAHRVLVVTDAGLIRAGHVERLERVLHDAGLDTSRFDEVPENPTTRDVNRCRDACRDLDIDLFIGFGGGSSIDTAKGCNFLLTNGGEMEDYWGVDRAKQRLLPMIAVPTTAGTGTEVQSFALIERAGDHQKMACGAASALPRIALLDPELTLTQPEWVTVCTGLDALTHAVESYVTNRRNEISCRYAMEAFRLIERNFPQVLASPDDLDARSAMLKAATFAGLAIENSMLGAAHSLANPLTAHHAIHHGQAVGMMLPHVVRFNAQDKDVAGWYAELASAAGLDSAGSLAVRIEELLALAGVAGGLASQGVEESGIPALAAEAATQWTARFNPRAVTAAELEGIYRAGLDA